MKRLALRLLRKIGILKHLNFNLRMRRHGRTYRIPIMGTGGIEHFFDDKETWMRVILRLLNNVMRDNGLFVDVGANIGQTLLKVKCCDDNWEYVGFEPNPNCVRYLYSLINANGFANVKVLPCAVADRSRIGDLFIYSDSATDASASIINNFRANVVTSLAVPFISGQEFMPVLGNKIAVLKIDVEGGELDVVKAFKPIIERDEPFIICEVLPVYKKSNMARLSRQLELEKILLDLDYRKFCIKPDGSLTDCKVIGIHGNIDDTNYLFCPAGSVDSIAHCLTFS